MRKRLTSILIPLVAIVAMALIGILLTIPWIQDYQSVRTDTILGERDLEQNLVPRRDILAAEDREDVEDVLEVLGTAVPVSADPGLVLGAVEDLSETHNLQLSELTFVGKDDKRQLMELSFRVFGSQTNTEAFIEEIESVRPSFYIIQFDSVAAETENGDPAVNTFVVLHTPFGMVASNTDGDAALTINENDREIINNIDDKFNYYDTALNYKNRDEFPKGKNDPFTE